MKARRITGLICAAVLGILAGFWGGSRTGEALFPCPPRLARTAGVVPHRIFGQFVCLGHHTGCEFSAAAPTEASQRIGALTGTDTLLPLSSLLIFLALFFSVNPTLLSNPLPEYRILGAAGGALCALVCWLVLRLLEPLDRQDTADLARLLSALLTACALVLVFAVAFQSTFSLLTKTQAIQQGKYRCTRRCSNHHLDPRPAGSAPCHPQSVGRNRSALGAVIWPASWSTSAFEAESLAQCEKKPPAAAVRSSRPPSCSPLEVIFSS